MSNIKGYCFIPNDDQHRAEVWPKAFVAMPLVGQHVESESGLSLRVISITHYMARIRKAEGISLEGREIFTTQKGPRIRVELAL